MIWLRGYCLKKQHIFYRTVLTSVHHSKLFIYTRYTYTYILILILAGSFMDKLTKFATGFQDRTKEQQAAILSSIESYGDYKPPPLPVVYDEMSAPQQEEKEIEHQVEKQGQFVFFQIHISEG